MQVYLDLLTQVLQNGIKRQDRTGTGTLSLFGYSLRFPLQAGFPLMTTKKIHFKSVVHELLWFLRGETNIAYLKENGVRIWDEWADENGELGPVYGKQWRSWGKAGIDQISALIEGLRKNPDSRRHLVSAWNVSELEQMKLQPCHTLFQCYVVDNRLSLALYQRSADIFLGLPFNIASYALLTHMLAQVCKLELGDFVHFIGDTHLYLNHIPQAELQLTRSPRNLPQLTLTPKTQIFDYNYHDIQLENYDPWPKIPAQVSV